jgi:hypothetical protein
MGVSCLYDNLHNTATEVEMFFQINNSDQWEVILRNLDSIPGVELTARNSTFKKIVKEW